MRCSPAPRSKATGQKWGLHTLSDQMEPTLGPKSEIIVHANVLRCCFQNHLFSVFAASKRVHFHLNSRGILRNLFILDMLMDMCERDYFTVRRWFRERFSFNSLR